MNTTKDPLPFNEDDFPGWKNAFDVDTRRELVHEDYQAWRNVCGLLLGIFAGGVLLGIAGVLIATS